MLLAVDPGLHEAAAALFFPDGTLAHSQVFRTPKTLKGASAWEAMADCIHAFGRAATQVVVEFPQVYHGKRASPNGNDLTELAAIVGGVVTKFAHLRGDVLAVYPRRWKGNRPKPVHHRQAFGKLKEEERPLWPKNHNARDAVALGLWRLKRLK